MSTMTRYFAQVLICVIAYISNICDFTVFQRRMQTVYVSYQVNTGCFDDWISKKNDSCHSVVKLVFKSLFRAIMQEHGEIWR